MEIWTKKLSVPFGKVLSDRNKKCKKYAHFYLMYKINFNYDRLISMSNLKRKIAVNYQKRRKYNNGPIHEPYLLMCISTQLKRYLNVLLEGISNSICTILACFAEYKEVTRS